MTAFINRKLKTSETLGEKLTHYREKGGISLKQAAQETGIKYDYLTALEKGDYGKLPGEVYIKGFLKKYAKFLGLNHRLLNKIYSYEWQIYQKTVGSGESSINLRPRLGKINFIITPKIIRNFVIGLILLACLVYLGVEVKKIIQPPFLLVNQPINNLITQEHQIVVAGQTEPEANIVINGQLVLGDRQGNFNKLIDLPSGVNIIKISVNKKHSREQVVYRRVMVVEETGG